MAADFGGSERATKGVQKGCDANSRKSNDFLDFRYSFPEPTVANIGAYYSGGGMNLAGCCDLGFCKEDAHFGVPAAKFGLGYNFELIRQLPERVGLPKSLEMIYTGRRSSAQQAFDMGLVQRLVADSERNTAETMALITQNAPLTIALAKAGARSPGRTRSATLLGSMRWSMPALTAGIMARVVVRSRRSAGPTSRTSDDL